MHSNGWQTTFTMCLDYFLSVITHPNTHTHKHTDAYCTFTDSQFLCISASLMHSHCGELGWSSLSEPPIDCLPWITFQTINTIKNPLKPLKPQRTSNHLTIKTHRKKTAWPVRAYKHRLLADWILLWCKTLLISMELCSVSIGCCLYVSLT